MFTSLLRLVGFIGFALSSSLVLASAHHSGATLGSFDVDQSGAATYSIPLQVPPGIGGMQPDVFPAHRTAKLHI